MPINQLETWNPKTIQNPKPRLFHLGHEGITEDHHGDHADPLLLFPKREAKLPGDAVF